MIIISFVDNPIINNPFKKPSKYYEKKNRKFNLTESRRPSGYWDKEEYVKLDLVNEIRSLVEEWRQNSYPNTTQITRHLLQYWTDGNRFRKLFFCQQELIETIIWLIEAAPKEIKDKIPLDEPFNIDPKSNFKPFIRYCGKMATGTGKTVVIACLIAWQVINSLYNVQDERFTNNILVVTPNRTVRQGDSGSLNPSSERNLYDTFDLVPKDLRDLLFQGNYFITNWHYFMLKDDSNKRTVLKRGKESDKAFIKRIISEGFNHINSNKNFFILNDEAHHAYRISPDAIQNLHQTQKKKIEEKIFFYKSMIEGLDEGVEYLKQLKASSIKKDQKLAKNIEELSKSEEILFRKIIHDYEKIAELEEIINAVNKGKDYIRKLKNSENKAEKILADKIQALEESKIEEIRDKIIDYYNSGQDIFRGYLKLNDELIEATVWIGGLDRIHSQIGINFCIDLSATPHYNKVSGHDEGSSFPWIVSDFCLADAIESGITKIPRYPLKDNAPETIARYYRLWKHIKEEIKKKDPKARGYKPESVFKHAQDALETLASQWKSSKSIFEGNNYEVPPLMIIICPQVNTAQHFYEVISQGSSIDDFKNPSIDQMKYTLQIDSSTLNKAEAMVGDIDPNLSKEEAFRELVSNIGKSNTNGQDVRCVISVGMLNEGWDAHNVTQILGVRAFKSSLLCEQVVGRGLRRMNYDDFTVEEYVDVYGIPFDFLPTKGEIGKPSKPKPTILIRAEGKNKAFEIRFPRVEGYNISINEKIKLDRSKCEPIKLDPKVAPTKVITSIYAGNTSEEEGEIQDREKAYKRMQLVKFHIANEVLNSKKSLRTGQKAYEIRVKLFPKIYKIVDIFIRDFVIESKDAPKNEIYLIKYQQIIMNQLTNAIIPDEEHSTTKVIPRIERFRPYGSSSNVSFRTSKINKAKPTKKSHINYVLCPNLKISEPKKIFETSPFIYSYIRNDHLGFSIPAIYDQTNYDKEYNYIYPDYIFTLLLDDEDIKKLNNSSENGNQIIWTEEQKNSRLIYVIYTTATGLDDFIDIETANEKAIKQWTEAVNNIGGLGTEYGYWTYVIKGQKDDLNNLIEKKRKEIILLLNSQKENI